MTGSACKLRAQHAAFPERAPHGLIMEYTPNNVGIPNLIPGMVLIIKECTSNRVGIPNLIEGVFLTQAMLRSVGPCHVASCLPLPTT